jgi:DNA-binding transcriptional ArsR family regulator
MKTAAHYYRAINNDTRLEILELIHNEGRLTVTAVYKALRLDQTFASQHLAVLRKAGLVNTEREGRLIFYSINYPRLKLLHSVADTLQPRKAYSRP